MILTLRVAGLVCELMWMNGLLFGFSLPQAGSGCVGVNLGPLCFLFYLSPDENCERCGRTLRWGLHGTFWGRPLCRIVPRPVVVTCSVYRCMEPVTDPAESVCEWHTRHVCPHVLP